MNTVLIKLKNGLRNVSDTSDRVFVVKGLQSGVRHMRRLK